MNPQTCSNNSSSSEYTVTITLSVKTNNPMLVQCAAMMAPWRTVLCEAVHLDPRNPQHDTTFTIARVQAKHNKPIMPRKGAYEAGYDMGWKDALACFEPDPQGAIADYDDEFNGSPEHFIEGYEDGYDDGEDE